MKDPSGTNHESLEEISALKQRIKELEQVEAEHKRTEAALRQSEEKYRSIFENTVEGIFQTTPEGRYLSVNPSYVKMFGYSSAEELTSGAFNVGEHIYANPEDRARFKEQISSHGIVQMFEFPALKKDGTPIWVCINARVVKDSTGKALYYEGTIEDITSLKKAQEALRKSEEDYRNFYDNAMVGIFRSTPEGRYLRVNPALAMIHGFASPEEMVRTVTNIGEQLYTNAQGRKNYMELLKKTPMIRGFEARLYRKDQSTAWISMNVRVFRGEDGSVSYYEGIVEDITERRQAEEALRESEERYRLLIENSHDIIYTLTPQGVFTFVSPSWTVFLGHPVTQVVGKQFQGFVHSDDAERCEAFLQRTIETGERQTGVEYRVQHIDGSWRWHKSNSGPVRDKVGTIVGFEGCASDITPRKIAEEELKETLEKLRQSEETLSAAINATHESLIMIDPSGTVLVSNTMGAERLGRGVRELVGTCLFDYFPPDVAASRKGRFDIAFKTGEPVYFEDLRAGIYFECYCYPIVDGRGVISRAAIFARDITGRKQAEEDLRATHQWLTDIIEFLPDSTFVIDEEKKVVAWNRACEEMTGVRKEEMIGTGNYSYALPFYGERKPILVDHVTVDSHELQEEYTSITRKGHVLCAEAFAPMLNGGKGAVLSGKASPLFDRKGRIVGSIESVRDITEIKDLESQLLQAQKMESIGTLAGGIAHDFNNILTTLVGYAALMQMKMAKGSPLQPYVDQILLASQKAADLTRSLLTFSRQQPVVLAPLDIKSTIESTKKLLARLLTEDIVLRTSFARDDTVVLADKSQIDQILFNLATNARDAMPRGGTFTIEVEAVELDDDFQRCHGYEPGRYVLLSISDTGLGMDEKTRERIFDPFFTTKETGKGTGLGLSTVYGIVKQHNGHISVYSASNIGTTFRIYLPALNEAGKKETLVPVPVKGGNETILVAEDSKSVRGLITEVLTQYGYKTVEAVDGADAIDKFKKTDKIDLLILDSVMPLKNGRDVYNEIFKIKPDIKVIFVSGHTRDVFLNKGIEDGMFNFLQKPISPNTLLGKIREVLDSGQTSF